MNSVRILQRRPEVCLHILPSFLLEWANLFSCMHRVKWSYSGVSKLAVIHQFNSSCSLKIEQTEDLVVVHTLMMPVIYINILPLGRLLYLDLCPTFQRGVKLCW